MSQNSCNSSTPSMLLTPCRLPPTSHSHNLDHWPPQLPTQSNTLGISHANALCLSQISLSSPEAGHASTHCHPPHPSGRGAAPANDRHRHWYHRPSGLGAAPASIRFPQPSLPNQPCGRPRAEHLRCLRSYRRHSLPMVRCTASTPTVLASPHTLRPT
jgi:hypothetical protein